MAKKKCYLTDQDKYRLWELVKEHRSSFEKGEWNHSRFAAHASEVLGMPLTASNISTALKAVGIVIPSVTVKRTLKSTREFRVGMGILTKELRQLMTEVGYTPSDEFQSLVRGLQASNGSED